MHECALVHGQTGATMDRDYGKLDLDPLAGLQYGMLAHVEGRIFSEEVCQRKGGVFVFVFVAYYHY
jgi:hypothetical protein